MEMRWRKAGSSREHGEAECGCVGRICPWAASGLLSLACAGLAFLHAGVFLKHRWIFTISTSLRACFNGRACFISALTRCKDVCKEREFTRVVNHPFSRLKTADLFM